MFLGRRLHLRCLSRNSIVPGTHAAALLAAGKNPSFARGEQKTGVVFELESGGVLQGVLQNQSGRGVAQGDVTLTQRVRVGEKTYRC